jgi:SAM-dependent methyltransferase
MNNERGKIDARFATVTNSKTFQRIVAVHDLGNKSVLDIGCGFGEHLVHFGKGSIGITTSMNEVREGERRNLDMRLGNAELVDRIGFEKKFEAIWSNNMLEHILSPHAFLIKLKTLVPDNGLLVLGVPVIPKIASLTRFSRFSGALASPHTNFFTRETLACTLLFAGWRIETMKSYFFPISVIDRIAGQIIVPHFYVSARNIGDFHYPPKKINEWQDDPYYADLLRITKSI